MWYNIINKLIYEERIYKVKTKTIFFSILLVLISVIMISCSNQNNESNKLDIEVFCDISQFANITPLQLEAIMGNPDEIIERDATYSGFVDIPCVYYEYTDDKLGELLFCFVNGEVVKFTAYGELPYYGKDTIKSLNCEMGNTYNIIDTSQRFRCPTNIIDDVHITAIDEETNTYASLSVTYDMKYFEKWYLPMSVSEETDYQIYTEKNVKSLLKSPKTADFANINDWNFGKNDFYVVVQSYVDAQNSFGAIIRSEFAFVYPVNSTTVIYAVFDGEVVADNGYIETEDLIKSIVTPFDNIGSSNIESNQTNHINEIQTVVDGACIEYNRDFAYYNSYINAVINSATSITVEQTIMDKIAPDDEGVIEWLEEGLVSFFKEAFENAEFPQEIEIIVNSTYEIEDGLNEEFVQEMETSVDSIYETDDSFDKEVESQYVGEGKIEEKWESDWISDSQLKTMYNYAWAWMGETSYLFDSLRDNKYTIIGTPTNNFGSDIVHYCSCNGVEIRIKYLSGEYLFFYDDLIELGVIK